jgi:hypothetical protein
VEQGCNGVLSADVKTYLFLHELQLLSHVLLSTPTIVKTIRSWRQWWLKKQQQQKTKKKQNKN